MPLVSVVVPCYNQARFIAAAAHSLQQQTLSDWEAIFVNDGSTDDTATALERLARLEPRFSVVSQPNQGLPAARNSGLSQARGQYVQFLDADDVLLPQKLQRQVEQLERDECLRLSYCDYAYGHAEDLSFLPWRRLRSVLDVVDPLLDFAEHWETELSIPIHSYLFDARFFRDHGVRFDPSLRNHEDWDAVMCILGLRPQIYHIDEVLVVYRVHPGGMTRNAIAMRDGFLKALHKQQRQAASQRSPVADVLRRRKTTIREYYRPMIEHQRRVLGRYRRQRLDGLSQRYLPATLHSVVHRLIGVPNRDES